MTDSLTGQARIDYWQTQIDAWENSGMSQQAFCREHSLNYPRFVYWRRKFRLEETNESAANTGFVPVMAATGAPESALSVSLPSGLQLHGIDCSNLDVVLQLLGRLP